MDRINIKNLEVFAKHGLIPEENVLGQKFVISAALFIDLRNAGMTDDFTKTLDYGGICRVIKSFIEENTYGLIEAAAEHLVEMLLIDNPTLQRVWLEIKKPWAPVAAHLETVSIEIERSRHTAFIALGSNMGDKEANLRFAIGELEKTRGCRVMGVSNFIDTAPYGVEEQDDFLNGCLELETLLTPVELMGLLHEIEGKAGRTRDVKWGPRTLDLDIIFYDDLVISSDTLKIPHADMHNREFVLTPLNEIAPWKLHPALNKTVAELLNELKVES
jgi:dihydroneopterin aldolase/2-amino-4-hydroxy-6-hydroxymethyldihydropteridine diphosphokinase